jgi:RimJ/RimL family protein N-acetyltransferase
LHPQADIHKKNAELGYWLAEPYWGKGIVSNAVKEIVTYGFENFDIDRIFARPFGTNIGSQKVLEKAGFILEGTFKNTLYKNGVYLDELIYAVRKNN